MGHKEVERTCNINNTFGSGAANKGTLQQRFKKFCQEDERLEGEESSGHPSKVNKDQLRAAIIKADHLTTTQEVAKKKNLNVNLSPVIQHLKQIGKVKNLSKWVPHELTENQKHCHFEVTSLILCNNKEPFLDWIVMYNEKCTLYNN